MRSGKVGSMRSSSGGTKAGARGRRCFAMSSSGGSEWFRVGQGWTAAASFACRSLAASARLRSRRSRRAAFPARSVCRRRCGGRTGNSVSQARRCAPGARHVPVDLSPAPPPCGPADAAIHRDCHQLPGLAAPHNFTAIMGISEALRGVSAAKRRRSRA